MKRFLSTIVLLGLALAPLAHAADRSAKKKKARPRAGQTTEGAPDAAARPAAARSGGRGMGSPLVNPTRRSAQTTRRAPERRVTQRPGETTSRRAGQDRTVAERNRGQANVERNRAVNRSRNNRGEIVTKNNRRVDRNSFAVARRNVIRVRHDRGWWRNRFPHTTFILFGGGYYYWWGNYWYPAYGYDPYYSNYLYDEPIYGYNQLPPGQVIENVQIALRDQGYYRGAIDGLIGPETRSAVADYQRDQGLVVTAAIDEPTLATLGLA